MVTAARVKSFVMLLKKLARFLHCDKPAEGLSRSPTSVLHNSDPVYNPKKGLKVAGVCYELQLEKKVTMSTTK